ncbi:DUF3179 domain-containing protein [Arcticibacterium luteifluviistationis]|uniref:DUF3179 domain-containing protein n=1 Tax=Arcticibacterium luteifluviistationis TaxID=1784714 RepID=A0A2Z4G760_9BACT|nr:DUF3179 domain-containing protein [Arcticibacterium luteifluviistationis]AWV97016.1 hypothetical protein DJ013_02020 [Arcticibacterium luteifluviistationis]
MMTKSKVFFIGLAVLISGCNKNVEPKVGTVNSSSNLNEEWDIPFAQVKDGGVGKDGIRSIDAPVVVEGDAATFLKDEELVLGIKYGNTAIAYPHKILDYHEIVNHGIEDFSYSISYCPLTGTGILYNRNIDNKLTTFGVSGLLFNSNLILYDRETGSNWPQMMLKSVNGEQRGKENEFNQLIETTWATWKKWYPDSKVMSVSENLGRNYDKYPYGNYKTNDEYLLYSVPYKLKNIPNKERILGIRNNGVVAYSRFNAFAEETGFRTRSVGGDDIYVFGSLVDNYMFAFKAKTLDGVKVEIDEVLLGKASGTLFRDKEGNVWSVFGEALEGERKGQKLQIPENYIGYAFAWAAFYAESFVVE